MKKADKIKAQKEWSEILKNHPSFARTFLAQQAILMEASELGYKLVDRSMCYILAAGLPILFENYWVRKCKNELSEVNIGGVIGCLTNSNRDPARCFNTGEEDWFNDPLIEGRILPPKPPIPPLKSTKV